MSKTTSVSDTVILIPHSKTCKHQLLSRILINDCFTITNGYNMMTTTASTDRLRKAVHTMPAVSSLIPTMCMKEGIDLILEVASECPENSVLGFRNGKFFLRK
jgi:hypothetical protein